MGVDEVLAMAAVPLPQQVSRGKFSQNSAVWSVSTWCDSWRKTILADANDLLLSHLCIFGP